MIRSRPSRANLSNEQIFKNSREDFSTFEFELIQSFYQFFSWGDKKFLHFLNRHSGPFKIFLRINLQSFRKTMGFISKLLSGIAAQRELKLREIAFRISN